MTLGRPERRSVLLAAGSQPAPVPSTGLSTRTGGGTGSDPGPRRIVDAEDPRTGAPGLTLVREVPRSAAGPRLRRRGRGGRGGGGGGDPVHRRDRPEGGARAGRAALP